MASDPDTATHRFDEADHPPLDEISFAHSSERVAAEILDYYHIRWCYEPKTFAIEWDGQGKVIASFTPDFYLPDFDLFIELTTMSQKLVTKKNRKVRRLKELYPEINIKVFYQKDFRGLLARFGIASVPVDHVAGGGVVAWGTDEAEEQPDSPGGRESEGDA